jgi:hypothetical protein
MPALDGTGPGGTGPMTGGARGYCAFVLPRPGSSQSPYGFAGREGRPTRMALVPAQWWSHRLRCRTRMLPARACIHGFGRRGRGGRPFTKSS